MTGLELFLAGAGTSGVNSALGVGQSFLGDWFGDTNREQAADIDWWNYQRSAAMDWQMYRDNYSPLNQQLQKEMYDYTSAKNLENLADHYAYAKRGLLSAGYNPILAINGGAPSGGIVGSVGAGASGPHSAHGVGVGSQSPSVDLGRLSFADLLSAFSTAKGLEKADAEIDLTKARTAQTLADTAKPGAVGQTERSLEAIVKQIGDNANSAWTQMLDFVGNLLNPPVEKEYKPHVGPKWTYDSQNRRSIYVGDVP